MKPVYEIKFLSSADFDKLPVTETNGSDISDSLGFYNPYTNRVFIRHSAYPELNKYLLDHEFEHLIEETATDADENGIRHKKGKKFLKELVPFFSSNPGYVFGDPRKETKKENSKNDSMIAQDKQNQMMLNGGSPFGNLQGSSPTFSGQDSNMSGLNQGLNQQTVNPLADPYAKYGQQQGRLYF